VLDLEHTRRGYFTEDHKRTLTTLAAQVAIAIENARLYEQIAKQEQRLERDLALAHELQFRLLPHAKPKIPNLEVSAKFVPARAIGGDLYDFIRYSLSRVGIVNGDVSGKGAPARDLCGAGQRHPSLACADRAGSGGDVIGGKSFAGRAADRWPICFDYLRSMGRRTTHLQVANSGLPRPIIVITERSK